MKYFRQLDGLRAIAVSLVLLDHFTRIHYWVRISIGTLGVHLFFVLSGFLITSILLQSRTTIEARSSSISFSMRQFYIRRFLRIFPIYYLTLLITYCLNMDHARAAICWNVSYMSNLCLAIKGGEALGLLSHFWSLSVEEQFYIFWPCLILCLPSRKMVPLVLMIISLGPLYRVLIPHCVDFTNSRISPMRVILQQTPGCLDLLGMGALSAYIVSKRKLYSSWKARYSGWTVALGSLLLTVSLTCWYFENTLYLHFILEPFAAALVSSWLIIKAVEGFGGAVGATLSNKYVVYVGRISYGIYVIHFPMKYYVERLTTAVHVVHTPGIIPVLNTVGTICLSALSWHFFEHPINKLKEKFSYIESVA